MTDTLGINIKSEIVYKRRLRYARCHKCETTWYPHQQEQHHDNTRRIALEHSQVTGHPVVFKEETTTEITACPKV